MSWKYVNAAQKVVYRTTPQGVESCLVSALADWLAEGNTPEPADVPDPKQIAQGKITTLESQNMLPRVVREYLLADFADKAIKAGLDPMLLPAYAKLKALDDQIKTLRAQL